MRRLIAAAFAAVILASPAWGQQCPSYAEVANGLASEHGESRAARGLSNAGPWVMEVWSNPETGSWTIVLMMADGTGCVADAGQSFETLPQVKGRAS